MVAEFVAIFVLAVLLALLLNGIVGEMDELVGGVLGVVLEAACADVPLIVPVSLDLAILNVRIGTSRVRSMKQRMSNLRRW